MIYVVKSHDWPLTTGENERLTPAEVLDILEQFDKFYPLAVASREEDES